MTAIANRDPYKIGLVAVAGGAVIAVLVTLVSTISFGTEKYVAHIAHTAGLRPGEDVQLAGVKVGQVKSIKLGAKDVEVTFEMSDDIRLGRQTEAEVKVATLLGTHYLAVDPQGSGELSGNSIPLAQTSVPYNLQDIIDRGTDALEKLDAPQLAKALTVVAEATEAGKEEFGPALNGIARVSEVIATRSAQAGELLTAARSVADQLSDSSADILSLMRTTTQVLDEIKTRRAAIHSLLVKTAALADALNSIVTSTRGDLDVALRDVRAVLAMLKSEDKTLRNALTILGPSARYLANATGSGRYAATYPPEGAIPDGMVCKGRGTC